MRRFALTLITLVLVLTASPASANTNLKPTAPVYYLSAFYGWPAWCGLTGWRIDSNGQSMAVQVIVGSVVDTGAGTCNVATGIAAADMDGTLVIRNGGVVICYAFGTTWVTPNYWTGGGDACPVYPGWNTVQLVAHWRLRANGAFISYTSPEFPVYIT